MIIAFNYLPVTVLFISVYTKMLKPIKVSSLKLERKSSLQVRNFIRISKVCRISQPEWGQTCVCVCVVMHVNVGCYCTFRNKQGLVKFPSVSHRGPQQHQVARPQGPLCCVWSGLPVCKHSIHRWYERLSEMWWLSSEVRAGDCCHLWGQRWDWLSEGEIQRASLTWQLSRLNPPDEPGRIITLPPGSLCWPRLEKYSNCIPGTSILKRKWNDSLLQPARWPRWALLCPYKSIVTYQVRGQRWLSRAEMPLSSRPISQVRWG